ncbi:MAG: hypothetical protein ABTR54_07925 [Candidatus Competibacter sp.]
MTAQKIDLYSKRSILASPIIEEVASKFVGSPAKRSTVIQYVTQPQKHHKRFISVSVLPSDTAFGKWCNYIDSLEINLKGNFDPSTCLLSSDVFGPLFSWGNIFIEFMRAIECYKELENDRGNLPDISEESARRFLLLAPLLVSTNPKIYLDTQTGNFNFDIIPLENGVLSAQVLPIGAVHYSYVAEHSRIYKITGTAKFKCSLDYVKFSKILRMI